MNIGFRRCEQGNYPEADKFLMESVEMFRKVLPAENWETAYCEPLDAIRISL